MHWKFCENVAFLLAFNGALSMTLCLLTKHWSTAEPAVFLTPSQEPERVLMFNWWACRECLLSEPMPNFSEHYSFPRPNTRERKHGSSAHPGWLNSSSCCRHLQRHCRLHFFPRMQHGMLSGSLTCSQNAAKRWMSLLVFFLRNAVECWGWLTFPSSNFFLCLSTKANPKRQGLRVCFTVH